MKKQMRGFIALCLCLVLVGTLFPEAIPVARALDVSNTVPQSHYSGYSTLAMVYDQNSCYSMQGMTVDNTYAYCAKIGNDDARAIVMRIDKSTGVKTLMTNSATGYSYFTNLGHANALDIVSVNGMSNLFVTGGSTLIRLTVSGTKLTTAGTYTATYNGAAASMTAVQIMSASNTEVKVLVKSGRTLYTGTLNPTASSGVIALTKLCTLDVTNVRLNGAAADYSTFTQQGFDYHDGKVFLPLSGNAYVETINHSVVLVYDIEGASGTVRNDPTLSFRIISGTYPGLFEIEDVVVCPMTGQLYFCTNRRKTASDTDYDGVSYFTGYAYNPKPGTIMAGDYRWETVGNEFVSVINGGNTHNQATKIHGDIVNGTMSQTIYNINRAVGLKPTLPWVIEWKSSGTFNGGSMLLANARTRGVTDAPFLFRYQKNEFIAIGKWNGTSHDNYGIRLGDYGIDGTAEHIYRLTNKCFSDGSNMVYLSVDGRELGPLNKHYVNATDQGTTSNWISGKTFLFYYMGSYGHPLNNCDLDYIQVWATGEPEDPRDVTVWGNEMATSSSTKAILYRGTANGTSYSGAAFRLRDSVKLLHNKHWAVEWEGDLSSQTFVMAASDGSKTKDAPFLFRYGANLVLIGSYTGSEHSNYGINLADYGIDGTANHVYRLTNKIAADGSNMVYLSVDGQELGPMNNYYSGINATGTTSDWLNGRDLAFDYLGSSAYPINGTLKYVQAWEDNAPAPEEEEPEVTEPPTQPDPDPVPGTATGTIPAGLDRVESLSELKEGVPYVISDYNDSWKHYALTTQVAQKVSGSKTHTGFLLSGLPSANTSAKWYIKDGYVVYGSANSDQYLLVSYDSASQGQVKLGSFNASSAAYVAHYSGDDFAIRSNYFLNRRGGTASDVVASAYTSAGGSYWHFDRITDARKVTLKAVASDDTVPAGSKTVITPEILVDGVALNGNTLVWSSSDNSVATVSGGVVSGVKAGKVTITVTLNAADGSALEEPISVDIPLSVTANAGTAVTVQQASLEMVSSIQTGIPYVITEKSSGYVLTGTMMYTTSSGYKGLNGTEGLRLDKTVDLNTPSVWYYDGYHLLYGSPTGTNNYLICNSSGQVALGPVSSPYIFDGIFLRNASDKSFTMSPSAKTSGSRIYYLNQLGGPSYNVTGLWHGVTTSLWSFNRLIPQRTLTLSVDTGNVSLTSGEIAALTANIKVNGTDTGNYVISWKSSDTGVATVSSNGVVTACSAGKTVVTVTLTSANGRALDEALTLEVPVQVLPKEDLTTSAVQAAKLVETASITKGVPYVVQEKNTRYTLTGTMMYTASSGYKGLNGTEGLRLDKTVDPDNAPVWYYDGYHLLYGSPTGTDNYLICNSAGQIALGPVSSPYIFDGIFLRNASDKSFTMSPSAKTSGSRIYYLNQLGGSAYNVAGLWHGVTTSLWSFSELIPEKAVTLAVTPPDWLTVGESTALISKVTVNGAAVTNCTLTYSTSNSSVVTVTNGTVKAVGSGSATVTVTLTAAGGDTFAKPLTLQIPVRVA